MQIVIDDYGPQLSKKVQDISALFSQNGIPLRVNTYWGEQQHCGGWVNYGSPEQFRNYSPQELRNQYENCHVAQYRCIGVFNGKMVNCCWAIFGRELGFMPFDSSGPDYQLIDLLDGSISIQEKKQIAASFGKTPLWACQYCNGFDSEHSMRYPAGEQA